MSYIRCLSNPEGLYIWGERGGRVAISVGSEPEIHYVPTRNFEAVLKKYVKDYGFADCYTSGPLMLVQENIPRKRNLQAKVERFLSARKSDLKYIFFPDKNNPITGKTFKERVMSSFRVNKMYNEFDYDNKWVLRYKGKFICAMWEVTLDRIASRFEK
jgi:hypothetical protein